MPDGTPMDASDIAEMLNSYKEPVVVPKVPIKTKYTTVSFQDFPIMKQAPYFDGRDSGTYIETLRVPIYKENIVDEIYDLAVNHCSKNLLLEAISVGYDIFINLEEQLKQRSMYTSASQSPTDTLIIHAPAGQILIYCSPLFGEITPIYRTYQSIMRIL